MVQDSESIHSRASNSEMGKSEKSEILDDFVDPPRISVLDNFFKWRKGAREYLQEYCCNTSLHGLKYVAGEKRTRFEKFIWSILFIAAVSSCAVMVLKTYYRWDHSPVIVSFSQNPTPIWEIPFPAVTICPQSKIKQSVHNFTQYYHWYRTRTLTEEENLTLGKLSLVCDFKEFDDKQFKNKNMEFEDDSLVEFLKKAAPDYDTFIKCVWNSEQINCKDIFKITLNDEGICYTFNMLEHHELFTEKAHLYKAIDQNMTMSFGWDLQNGYSKYVDLKAYPRRVLGAGIENGLEVILKNNESDLDYICKTPIQGYKVVLHEAGNLPNSKTNYISAPVNQEVVIAVQPQYLKTSYNLKSYKPQKRKCYFQDERKLEFFRRYTQRNCNLECFTQATIEECGCVAFFMPRNETTHICGAAKAKCVRNAEVKFLKKFFEKKKNSTDDYIAACDCMPACFSLQYGAETSQAVIDVERYYEAIHSQDPVGMSEVLHLTSLKIFFKEQQFIATERNELYGAAEFLANCGGLFGLFTGFSLLSLLEIIYYLTIRMWVNKKLFGKYLMATPDDPDKFKMSNKLIKKGMEDIKNTVIVNSPMKEKS